MPNDNFEQLVQKYRDELMRYRLSQRPAPDGSGQETQTRQQMPQNPPMTESERENAAKDSAQPQATLERQAEPARQPRQENTAETESGRLPQTEEGPTDAQGPGPEQPLPGAEAESAEEIETQPQAFENTPAQTQDEAVPDFDFVEDGWPEQMDEQESEPKPDFEIPFPDGSMRRPAHINRDDMEKERYAPQTQSEPEDAAEPESEQSSQTDADESRNEMPRQMTDEPEPESDNPSQTRETPRLFNQSEPMRDRESMSDRDSMPDREPMSGREQMPQPEFSAPAPQTSEGYLQVRVSTARGAIPLAGAQVTVSGGENSEKLYRTAATDRSGLTPIFSLPTVSRSLSEFPQDVARPYTNYTVHTELEGYVPVEDINVAIFDGETTLQPVNMLPVSAGKVSGKEVIDDAEPNL